MWDKTVANFYCKMYFYCKCIRCQAIFILLRMSIFIIPFLWQEAKICVKISEFLLSVTSTWLYLFELQIRNIIFTRQRENPFIGSEWCGLSYLALWQPYFFPGIRSSLWRSVCHMQTLNRLWPFQLTSDADNCCTSFSYVWQFYNEI